jgi:acetylglutamate kinase
MQQAQEKTATLVQAIKYINKFENKIVVVKYGGNAMTSETLKKSVFEDIAMLWQLGLRIVVVNGGGPKIDLEMEKNGLKKRLIHGLRVTNAETLDIVKRTLCDVNRDCVEQLNGQRVKAMDCTEDIFLTKIRDKKLGYVGDVIKVQTKKLLDVLEQGIIPVVSSIGCDKSGQLTNINADVAAAAAAIALKAEKLTILTNVDAVADTHGRKISHLSIAQAEKHIKNGTINGGMIPKVRSCIEAVGGGVKKAHLLNGTMPRTLILEIFTKEGVGTEVVKS